MLEGMKDIKVPLSWLDISFFNAEMRAFHEQPCDWSRYQILPRTNKLPTERAWVYAFCSYLSWKSI